MSALVKITEKPIFQLLEAKKADIIRFIGEDRFKKEVSFAIQAANSNEYLSNATPASVAKAIFNLAMVNLSLNPVQKLAYLVPKSIKGQVEAVLMPSYQGLVQLILEGKSVKRINARVVYDGDEFEYSLGLEDKLEHKPKNKTKEVTHVYAVAFLEDGTPQIEVMTREEIDGIKMRSDSGKKNTGPWVTDYSEMARKTVIRRIYKYLPKGTNHELVSEAIKLDEQDYPATIGQISYIESLLQTSNVDHEERGNIERNLSDMTAQEAQDMIEFLKENQLDKIAAGLPYNMTDIKQKIDSEIQPLFDNEKEETQQPRV
jgi:recombination protein RecT